MIEHAPTGVTAADIAERYRRSESRVRSYWIPHPDWRDRVRVLGRTENGAPLYHAGDVHELLRDWVWLPPADPNIPPERLLTLREVAEYTGISYGTVRSDESKGKLGPPDDVREGVRRWRRDTIDNAYWAKQIRKTTT